MRWSRHGSIDAQGDQHCRPAELDQSIAHRPLHQQRGHENTRLASRRCPGIVFEYCLGPLIQVRYAIDMVTTGRDVGDEELAAA
jgi:hypothetical protein